MERLCYATEFEIEGWKKILPLTDMIEEYIQLPLEKIELKMHKLFAVDKPAENPAVEKPVVDTDYLIGKTIRTSKIYDHFNDDRTRNEKLVIYVSQTIPINENYCRMNILNGQHCVVATGIDKINGVECLLLENTGGNEDFNSIPIDLPFFEEVSNKIGSILQQNHYETEKRNRNLNSYGCTLAQMKWKNLKKKDWNAMVKKEADRIDKNLKKEEEPEYQMFFVKGAAPIYKLEFARL